jgi:hypothetical protein
MHALMIIRPTLSAQQDIEALTAVAHPHLGQASASVDAGPYHPAGVPDKRSWRVVSGALGRLDELRCGRRR